MSRGREAFGDRGSGCYRELRCGTLEDRLRGERGERRLLGRLPDDGVAADERESGVPAPHSDGKVEGGDDADDAERVPGLHHAVVGALGGQCKPRELTRKPSGEGADVDHLLDLPKAFGEELSGLDRNEAAERGQGSAQLLAEEPDELTAFGGWNASPLLRGCVARARLPR